MEPNNLNRKIGETWTVGDDKVSLVKKFPLRKVVPLLKEHLDSSNETQSPIYKPHFNFPILMAYLSRGGFKIGANHDKIPKYIEGFFEEYLDSIDGLYKREFSSSLGTIYHLEYLPECLGGQQDPEAVKRRRGLVWGD